MAAARFLISSQTVGAGGTSAVTFSSIPQTYTDLVLKYTMRTAYAGIDNNTLIEFNGSAASIYSLKALYGTGSAIASFTRTGASASDAGYAPGSTATASVFSNTEIYIPNYTSSNNKSFYVDSAAEHNNANVDCMIAVGLWASTAAISQIKITDYSSNTISQYSSFSLYGIKNS